MTSHSRLRAQIVKEARALLPTWMACLAAICAPLIAGVRRIEIEYLVYGFAATGLGALAIGREYSDHTLPFLLAQPVDRRRLLAIKIAVVTAMLAPLAGLFAVVGRPFDFFRSIGLNPPEAMVALFLPALGALVLTPWLTMATRNPFAGAVFTMSIPALPILAADLLHALVGTTAPTPRFVVWESLALCAVPGFAGYRLFMRLETLDDTASNMRLPEWLHWRSSARPPHGELRNNRPVWLLVRKELHLQRVTFTVGALYALGWLIAVLLRPRLTDALTIFYVLSVFHAVEVALLSGSLASAEERHGGTLEWQLLMPVPVARQWAIKSAVVLATAVALGCVLPAVAAFLAPPGGASPAPTAADFVGLNMLTGTLLIAAVSLYASSFSASALRALMTAVLIAVATMTAGAHVGTVRLLSSRTVAAPVLVASAIALLLAYGMTNHRSMDNSPVRILKQGVLIATGVAAATLAAWFVTS